MTDKALIPAKIQAHRMISAKPLGCCGDSAERTAKKHVAYFNGLTSRVTLLILPVNRVSVPMPIPSATGV